MKGRWGWRRIHKWISVVAGVFLLIWIVTGIFISLPPAGGPQSRRANPVPDYSLATLSPAEAATTAASFAAAGAAVNDIELVRLAGRAVYQVMLAGVGPVLIDAVTGERITVDADEALRIATTAYTGDGTPSTPERVEEHSLRYMLGGLPAWRIAFDDRHGTEVHVVMRNGATTWSGSRHRFRMLMAAGHDWWPLGVIGGPKWRSLALVLSALLALAAALTGYWLAVRRVKRIRS